MTQQDLLTRLETELRTAMADVRAQFSERPPETLKRRPDPQSWNILECFAHLNRYAEDYIPHLELAIHKAKARRWVPGEEVRYFGRGKRAIRRADPENDKRYKSAKAYNFYQLALGPEVVKSFLINSERLLRVIQAAREIDINRAKVKKARSWTGRYSLANLLEFLITHTRRHLAQAQRLV